MSHFSCLFPNAGHAKKNRGQIPMDSVRGTHQIKGTLGVTNRGTFAPVYTTPGRIAMRPPMAQISALAQREGLGYRLGASATLSGGRSTGQKTAKQR
jgi:hypothetical protein